MLCVVCWKKGVCVCVGGGWKKGVWSLIKGNAFFLNVFLHIDTGGGVWEKGSIFWS